MALCFHTVTDGMAKIQLHSGAGIEFILCYDVAFEFDTAGDYHFAIKSRSPFGQMGE